MQSDAGYCKRDSGPPIGLVELLVRFQLVDAVGTVYGSRVYTVKPYSLYQINDVFGAEFASFQPPLGCAC